MVDRPLCKICGKNLCKYKSKRPDGEKRYSVTCSRCEKRKYGLLNKWNERHRYRKHLENACARCGFTPEHSCQLDVHHKNRIRTDNAVGNLETLCANCHRLEHHVRKGENDA